MPVNLDKDPAMRWPPPQNEVYLGPGEQTSSFEAINDSTFRYFVEIDVEVPATLSPEFDQVLAGTDRRGRFVLVDERRRHASTKSIDLTLQSTTRKVLNCSAMVGPLGIPDLCGRRSAGCRPGSRPG